MAEDKKMAAIDFGVIGDTGLNRTSGIVSEEFHRALKGARGRKVLTEMGSNEPVIAAILYIFEIIAKGLTFEVHENKETAGGSAASEAAGFLEECIEDMEQPLGAMFAEGVSTMLLYGFCPFEVIYKIRGGNVPDPTRASKHDDGLIGWRSFGVRPPSTVRKWEFDGEGNATHLIQRVVGGDDVEIPMTRMVLFRHGVKKNSPEGVSLFRGAYRPWFIKKTLEEIEASGIEMDLTGLPVMWVPEEMLSADASDAAKATLAEIKTMLQRLQRDEQGSMVLPSKVRPDGSHTGWDFELLASPGRHQIDTSKPIARYRHEIATVALAELILLGSDGVGSYALSQTKGDLMTLGIKSVIDGMFAVFNRQAVARLFALNPRFPVETWPTLGHAEINPPPVSEIIKTIAEAADSTLIVPDDSTERDVRRRLDLPEKDAGAAAVDAAGQ